MVVQRESSSGATRIGMRAHERAFTIADNASLKTIFVMTLRGASAPAIASFLTHLPEALVLTFNRHPRMRALQVRNEFAMAEIQPRIAFETLAEMNLLKVREVVTGGQGNSADANESWEHYTEAQANLALDRYTQFPYYVRAWHYPQESRVRLFLCCDHYMSDGISGMVVLNDIVTLASELSRDQGNQQGSESELLALKKQELPLRPPLYELWLDSMPWTAFFGRMMLKMLRNIIFSDPTMQFKPVIKPRADQADLAMPIPVNSSSMLFGDGASVNMQRALQRCKEEGVTLFGAIAASVMVAYYIACDDEKRAASPFKLGFEVVANMRGRVPEPVPEVQVGTYMNSYALDCLLKEGVELEATCFWDLARKTRSELDAHFYGFTSPMRLLVVDEYMTTNQIEETLEVLKMPHSCSADIMVSNIGRYEYETTLAFQTAENKVEELKIESVHVGGSFPHMGTATILYVTSVDKLNYGFMHKYEDAQGKELFEVMMKGIERIGDVAGKDTMIDVVRAVQEAL